jgi:hypothetical protein
MTAQNLCVDHYLDEALGRLEKAVTSCRDGHVVSPETLERLKTHADFAVNFLSDHQADDCLRQKELLLQFLLGLANLHEYLSHNAPLVGRSR